MYEVKYVSKNNVAGSARLVDLGDARQCTDKADCGSTRDDF